MDKNTEIDSKKLNQVLRLTSKILKKLYLFIIAITIYVLILILGKLNMMLFLGIVLNILSPLFIGALVAWLLRPIVKYLINKGINKIIAVIVVYILIIFFSYIILSTLIPIFIKETNEFLITMPSLLDDIYKLINNTFSNIKIDLSIIKDEVIDVVNISITKMGRNIPITLVNFFKGIWTFALGFIIGFYLLITDTTFINKTLNTYLKKDTYLLLLKINEICRSYVRGTLLSSLLIFVLSTITFYIGGLESSLLFGFICGITNIIPFIGPYVGAFIPVIVAFTKSISTGIIISVMILIIQTIESNIISPIIISKSIKIHPVTVIISLLVFGYFFGILGMIIATPLVAILKELYFYIIKRYNSYKRKLVR